MNQSVVVTKLVGSVLVGVSILAGCGGPDLEARQTEVQAWLENNGYSATEAQCVASATREKYELSDFEELDGSDGQDGLSGDLADFRDKCSR